MLYFYVGIWGIWSNLFVVVTNSSWFKGSWFYTKCKACLRSYYYGFGSFEPDNGNDTTDSNQDINVTNTSIGGMNRNIVLTIRFVLITNFLHTVGFIWWSRHTVPLIYFCEILWGLRFMWEPWLIWFMWSRAPPNELARYSASIRAYATMGRILGPACFGFIFSIGSQHHIPYIVFVAASIVNWYAMLLAFTHM